MSTDTQIDILRLILEKPDSITDAHVEALKDVLTREKERKVLKRRLSAELKSALDNFLEMTLAFFADKKVSEEHQILWRKLLEVSGVQDIFLPAKHDDTAPPGEKVKAPVMSVASALNQADMIAMLTTGRIPVVKKGAAAEQVNTEKKPDAVKAEETPVKAEPATEVVYEDKKQDELDAEETKETDEKEPEVKKKKKKAKSPSDTKKKRSKKPDVAQINDQKPEEAKHATEVVDEGKKQDEPVKEQVIDKKPDETKSEEPDAAKVEESSALPADDATKTSETKTDDAVAPATPAVASTDVATEEKSRLGTTTMPYVRPGWVKSTVRTDVWQKRRPIIERLFVEYQTAIISDDQKSLTVAQEKILSWQDWSRREVIGSCGQENIDLGKTTRDLLAYHFSGSSTESREYKERFVQF